MNIPKTLTVISESIEEEGGTAYLVGGAVRDHLMNSQAIIRPLANIFDIPYVLDDNSKKYQKAIRQYYILIDSYFQDL